LRRYDGGPMPMRPVRQGMRKLVNRAVSDDVIFIAFSIKIMISQFKSNSIIFGRPLAHG
jgi:hypothetical protein